MPFEEINTFEGTINDGTHYKDSLNAYFHFVVKKYL